MRAILLILLASALAAQTPEAPFHEAELIFPLEHWHNHASTLIELPNRDLLVAWYHGSGERTADDVIIEGSRLPAGSRQWSRRFLLADSPGFPDCNPALFLDATHRLWMFWPLIIANQWETALLSYKSTTDYAAAHLPIQWQDGGGLPLIPRHLETRVKAWLEPLLAKAPAGSQEAAYFQRLIERSGDKYFARMGWMPRAHPVQLPSGRILLPLYSDGYDFSLTAISDDEGRTWHASEPMLGLGAIQPSIARRKDGSLVAFFRDNGPPPKRLLRGKSRDEGESWTIATDTEIPNPGSGSEVIVLRDGLWAFTGNDTEKGRNSLVVALSDDEGTSWKWKRHLELDQRSSKPGSYHYPSILEAMDGMLHVSYSYFLNHLPDNAPRKSIKHARFNRAWVRQGDQ